MFGLCPKLQIPCAPRTGDDMLKAGDAEMPRIPLADTRKYQCSGHAEMLFFFRATNGLSQVVLSKNGSIGYARSLSQNHEGCFLLVFILFPHYLLPPNLRILVIDAEFPCSCFFVVF